MQQSGKKNCRVITIIIIIIIQITLHIELENGCPYKPERPHNHDTTQAIEQQKRDK